MNLVQTAAIALMSAGLVACASSPSEPAKSAEEMTEAEKKKASQFDGIVALKTEGGDRIICKETGRSGTRLRKSEVCRTKDEWDRMRAESKADIKDLQDKRSVQGD